MSLQNVNSYTYTPGFTQGQYHNAVICISGNVQSLYLNGVLVGSTTTASNILSYYPTINQILLGCAGDKSNGFTGYLDDFRMYNYAFNSSQVSNLYSNRNVIAYYPFDSSLNATTPNHSTMVYDASLVGNAVITTSTTNYKVGTGALSLTNTAGIASTSYMNSTCGFSNTTNNNLSISLWFKTSAVDGRIMRLIDLSPAVGTPGIFIDISGTNGINTLYNKIPITIPVVVEFSPLSINGLRLWLDANSTDITSVWPDKSGLSNNLTGGFTVVSNLFNNKKTVRLTGNATSSVSFSSMPITMFVVFNSTNTGGYNYLSVNPTGGGLQMAIDPQNRFFINLYGGGGTIAPNFYPLGTSGLYILSIRLTGTGNNYTNAFVNYNGTNIANTTTNNTVASGNLQIHASSNPYYISEYLLYNTALTNTQIQEVEGYLASKWNIQGLVLHWPFDTNMNESVNGYTGTLYGTTPAISNSVYRVGTGSLDCTGTLAYVMYSNLSGTILPISNTYTFSFWYYPTSGAKYYSHLFAFSNAGGNDEIGIYFNLNALDLYVIMKNGSSSIYSSAGSQITNVFLTVNTWNHIALSITSTSSNISFTLWRNNSKTTYNRASSQGIPQVARQLAFMNGAGTTPLPPSTSGDSPTTAYVDDFRVYTTLLTDAEVTTLYNTR